VPVEHEVHEHVPKFGSLSRPKPREALHGVFEEVFRARHCDKGRAVPEHTLWRHEDIE
jgi:hypothetical protein